MQTFTAAMPEPGLEAEGGCGLDGALSLPCLGRAPGGAECLSAADVGALCHSGASLCCSWQVNPRSPRPPALRTSAVQQGTCDTALAACCKPARSWQYAQCRSHVAQPRATVCDVLYTREDARVTALLAVVQCGVLDIMRGHPHGSLIICQAQHVDDRPPRSCMPSRSTSCCQACVGIGIQEVDLGGAAQACWSARPTSAASPAARVHSPPPPCPPPPCRLGASQGGGACAPELRGLPLAELPAHAAQVAPAGRPVQAVCASQGAQELPGSS